MICGYCKTICHKFAWDETSHLGKRPICYNCIHKRDVAKINSGKCMILYRKLNTIRNSINTLSFKILKEDKFNSYTKLSFNNDGKKWVGVAYLAFPETVYCKVLK